MIHQNEQQADENIDPCFECGEPSEQFGEFDDGEFVCETCATTLVPPPNAEGGAWSMHSFPRRDDNDIDKRTISGVIRSQVSHFDNEQDAQDHCDELNKNIHIYASIFLDLEGTYQIQIIYYGS